MTDLFGLGLDYGGAEGEGEAVEFIVSGPAVGWTEGDTEILERALDLAGITEPAARVAAAMSVDMMGIVILTPMVREVGRALKQISDFFDGARGGIGK